MFKRAYTCAIQRNVPSDFPKNVCPRHIHAHTFACLTLFSTIFWIILDYPSQVTLDSKFHLCITYIDVLHTALGLEGGGGGKVGNDGLNLPTF